VVAQSGEAGVEVAAGDFDQAVGVEQQGGTRRQRLRGVRPAAEGARTGAEEEPLPGVEVLSVPVLGQQEGVARAAAVDDGLSIADLTEACASPPASPR
jgi:hypothetical protein